MNITRAVITSKTAHWRDPSARFMQPVFFNIPYPPPHLTTIWGLLSAASGEWITPNLGIIWRTQQTDFDLQTMRTAEASKIVKPLVSSTPSVNSNGEVKLKEVSGVKVDAVKVPLAWNNYLELFIDDPEMSVANSLLKPAFPISLGRSEDLARIDQLETLSCSSAKEGQIIKKGSVVIRGQVDQSAPQILINSSKEQAPGGKTLGKNRENKPLPVEYHWKDLNTKIVNPEGFISTPDGNAIQLLG